MGSKHGNKLARQAERHELRDGEELGRGAECMAKVNADESAAVMQTSECVGVSEGVSK